MSKSNYPLRLQTSLLNEVRRLAEAEGASINQFINVAVAEKLSALRTESYFRERAERADVPAALALLERPGTEPPRPGDDPPVTIPDRLHWPCRSGRVNGSLVLAHAGGGHLLPSSQTAAFRQLVRDHLRGAAVVVPAGTPGLEAVDRMAAGRASAALAVDAAGRLAGILTEHDVVRRVAGRDVGATPIGDLMTRPVHAVGADDLLYRAIGLMRRLGLRHMPVVDGAGRPAGMLHLHDALAAANAGLVDEIDRLTHEDTLDGLREVKAAQVQLAADLLADNVPAPEILALVSDLNNDINRRVIRLCLAALRAGGRGDPPVAFAAIVMGSGGRGESYLSPDQDNGFVLDDYPDTEHDRIDPFFIELAERMTNALDGLGFPLCRGGVMAINPVWRKTLPQWCRQVDLWLARRSDVMLQLCDVFFDFRGIDGDPDLARRLRDHVTRRVLANPGFVRDLYAVQAEHRAAIGLFGRLQTERADRARRGELNLKYGGTLPLAEAVRLMALRHGVPDTGTPARIDALTGQGVLSADERDHLRGAFDLITGLQLRRQVRAVQAGEPPSNHIDPALLTERETDLLKAALRAINAFRDRVRSELTGAIF